MHYVITAFNFGGNCLVEKGSCTDLFQLFFWKDKKSKKLAVALKLLTVLSLNSIAFC